MWLLPSTITAKPSWSDGNDFENILQLYEDDLPSPVSLPLYTVELTPEEVVKKFTHSHPRRMLLANTYQWVTSTSLCIPFFIFSFTFCDFNPIWLMTIQVSDHESRKPSQKASESISGLKFKNVLGVMPPDPSLVPSPIPSFSMWKAVGPGTRNHVMEREGERKSKAPHRSKVIEVVNTIPCK